MNKIKLSVATVMLAMLSVPALADDMGAVQDKQPAPVGIAPTVRMQQSTPAIIVPTEQVTSGAAQPVKAPDIVKPDVVKPDVSKPDVSKPDVSKASLTFMDSKLFDMKLGKELEAGKDVVEVDISGRVPLSNIPPRIDNWVVHSAEEGKVELLQSEPAPKTRFIFSLIPMVFNAFGSLKAMQEERMFDQAKRYDTKIYYKKDETGDTLIDKIVLIKRKAK